MSNISDSNLIEQLRKAASTWFKNSDLLLLEELIRRYHKARSTDLKRLLADKEAISKTASDYLHELERFRNPK
jgi:hypothetical protein